MEDPVGAARHARETLAQGRHLADRRAVRERQGRGEPQPGRARLLLGVDDAVRAALARASGPALGAQAGEARLREVVVDKGGFSRFRRATETPFNLILEARP